MDSATGSSPENPDLDTFLGVVPPSRRSFWVKRGAIGLGILIALYVIWRVFFGGTAEITYATEPLEKGQLRVTVSATGNLAPTNQVTVGSELSGLIAAVNVDNNDHVTRGQILVRLDISRLTDTINQSRAALAAALAKVQEAEATAAQAAATLRRQEEVFRISGGKVPSATELDNARADRARAQAAVASARAAVAQAEAQLSADRTQLAKATIRSPVNGVVLSRTIEPGQTVAASFNAPTLFTIAEDLQQMRLEVKVDEADVGQVRKGQKATFQVDAFPGRTFPARIERVDLGANTTGTTTTSTVIAYTARLTVDNRDGLLRPGMTATADITTNEKSGIWLVPNAALRFTPDKAGGKAQSGGLATVLAPQPMRRPRADRSAAISRGSNQTIYVLGDDGKPTPLSVKVGDSDGSFTEVSGADVRAGLTVITGQLAAGQSQQSGGGKRRQAGNGG